MDQEDDELGQEPFGDDALESLRERVLRGTLDVLAIAVPAISALIVILALAHGQLDRTTIVLSVYTLGFPLVRFARPRLGFRWSALWLLGQLALTSFFVEARGGVAVGNIALNVLVLLLSALFFGRRGAALGLLAVLGLFALAGLVVVLGLGPRITPEMWDPVTAVFWMRESLALALLGGAIAVTEVYVVERLAREARRLRSLAAREQQQRLALERAEQEREHERAQRLAAQKALEESHRMEALARLAGGIAHDFNNALTVIMSTADLLKKGASSPAEVEECASDISEAAQTAGELTRQLLTLGRRQVSKPQSVSMAPLLGRMRTALRRILPSDIALLGDAPPDGVTAHVDPSHLERALLNMAINARDAMPHGGKLAIECALEAAGARETGTAERRCVAVTVSDTGEGIAPEMIERIFEPFFTTKTAGMGTGLGLATVYAFAKEAGGDIRVTSTLGAGTTFKLLLPEDVRPEAAAGAEPPAPPVALAMAEGASVPVLVVEDRPDVRASMVKILTGGGFEVSEAADGDCALSVLAERNDFALLCIDGVMPGAATGAVIERAARLAPSMRVLLCSGYLPEDLLRRGVATGRYAFLQKPFSAEELLTSVHGLLSSPDAV